MRNNMIFYVAISNTDGNITALYDKNKNSLFLKETDAIALVKNKVADMIEYWGSIGDNVEVDTCGDDYRVFSSDGHIIESFTIVPVQYAF